MSEDTQAATTWRHCEVHDCYMYPDDESLTCTHAIPGDDEPCFFVLTSHDPDGGSQDQPR